MSHSSNTPNYSLPLFSPANQPDFIADLNPAMTIIDNTMKEISDRTPDSSQVLAILSALGLNTVSDAQALLDKIDNKMDKHPIASDFGEPTI